LTKNWRGVALNLLKWLWMLAVLLALGVYINNNFTDIQSQLKQVPMPLLLLSLALAMIGRMFFITVSSEVLVLLGHPQNFQRIFYVAATSELGKYLPGGIWHLVGRAAYYRGMGLPLKTISRAILQENLWMLLSSGMAALCFFILAYTKQFFAVGILLICWWLIIYLWVRPASLLRVSAQMLIQIMVWLCFSYSFALLLPAEAAMMGMAAFALSWLLGLVVIFAPGGIGVREASLVAILSATLPASQVLVLAVVHRLIWIAIELLFGLIAWVFFSTKTSHAQGS
jgi:glycosyltransferase 2 family protein